MLGQFLRGALLTGCGLFLTVSFADEQQQQRSRTTPTAAMSAELKPIMERIESRADVFDDKFETALDNSDLNGTDLEDRLNRWADILEDEVDNMAEDYKENDSQEMIRHLENALIVGQGINRVMLRQNFQSVADTEWKALREDLNFVAQRYSRPVLPNITVTKVVIAAPEMLQQVNVRQAMERIESATDRFEGKFRNAIQHSTANMRDRERWWDQWADGLEDVSDEMLEEYKEKDAKEFNEKLQNTLVVAAAINRIILRSDFTEEVTSDWNLLREDLNVVAQAFGHPVLPNMVATSRAAK